MAKSAKTLNPGAARAWQERKREGRAEDVIRRTSQEMWRRESILARVQRTGKVSDKNLKEMQLLRMDPIFFNPEGVERLTVEERPLTSPNLTGFKRLLPDYE